MNPSPTSPPQVIHLIFKTHLDVGFTDFSANVVRNYFQHYIPRAIELAREMRQSGSDRFVWTTGSWLIYEYLEQASAAERRLMEEAITAGDITWHALPFTTHSENMDASLFRFGLTLSQELDRRYGKHTIAAKMTDVPGHTRGIVPLLAEAGVQFLHIGVNGASTPPDVPPVFTWRDPPSGSDVMVMYHKGSYGDLMIVPGMQDAIAFAHTGDNMGPQSAQELRETYHELRQRFPGVNIQASTLDAFATRLAEVKPELPVIEQEIGDTWIHGVGTDPKKVARYRELLRLRRQWLQDGVPPEEMHAFSRGLLPVSEHTWGLDVKTHLGDWSSYAAPDFRAARSGANFQKMEASWREQRAYIDQAVKALPSGLMQEAEERLERLEPSVPDLDQFAPVMLDGQSYALNHFRVSFDQNGWLNGLETEGIEWCGPQNPLGSFWYQTFSADDYRRFYRQYNVNKRWTREWSIPDFTKPGIDTAAPEQRIFFPTLVWSGHRSSEDQDTFLLLLEMPDEGWQEYGAPRQVSIEIVFHQRSPEVEYCLQWFGKPACRLPEAVWFSFIPKVAQPKSWQMDKLGEWVSPLEVIRDGNRHLHAVGQGLRYQAPGQTLWIDTLDAPLVAPGKPSMLNFTNRQPNLAHGLHFNLYNNLWGTNFPMWYGEDARFRFRLRFKAG